MATESLPPSALTTQTNLTGAVTDIDDDPDSPDGLWLTADNDALDTICHVTFDTPSGNLTVGTNNQTLTCWVRRSATGGTNPQVRLSLYENGGLIGSGSDQTVTSDSGEAFGIVWDETLITDITGAGVEFRVTGIAPGGKPSDKRTVEVGAIEWDVTYDSGSLSTRIHNDTAAVTDSVTVEMSYSITASDTAAVADQAATAMDIEITSSDTIGVADSISAILESLPIEPSIATDTVVMSDSSQTSLEYARGPPLDTAIVTDQVKAFLVQGNPGDHYIRKNTTDTTSLTTSDFVTTWNLLQEDSGNGLVSYSAGEFRVNQTGPYLIIHNSRWATADSTSGEPFRIQQEIRVNGTPVESGKGTGFLSKEDADHTKEYPFGAAILELTSGDTIEIVAYRTDDSTVGTCGRETGTGGVQFILLSDKDEFGIYSTSSTEVTTATQTALGIDTNDREDKNFTRSGSSINVAAPGLYLMTVGGGISNGSASEGEIYTDVTLNGTPVPGTVANGFVKGTADNCTDGALSGIYLINASAGDDIDFRIADNGAAITLAAGFQVALWRIPDHVTAAIYEATDTDFHVYNTEFTGWDTNPYLDAGDFSATTPSTSIEVDQAGDYLQIVNLGVTSAITTPHASVIVEIFKNSGTWAGYGTGGRYARGASGMGMMSCTAAGLWPGQAATDNFGAINYEFGADGAVAAQSAQMALIRMDTLYNGNVDRYSSDTSAVTDQATAEIITGAAQTIVSDTAVVSDQITIELVYDLTVTDTDTVSDQTSTEISYERQVSDTAVVTDQVTAALFVEISISISDSVSTTDQAATALEQERTVTDTATVTDQVATALEQERTVTDTATVTDQAVAEIFAEILVSISDSVSGSDQVSTALEYEHTISDSVSTTDQVVSQSAGLITRTLSDSVVSTDQVTTALEYESTIDDSAVVTDQVTVVALVLETRTVSDSAATSDQVSTELELGRVASDTPTTTDQTAISLSYERTISDSVSTTDQITIEAAGTFQRADADAVGVSDQVAIELEYGRTASDSAVVTEQVVAGVGAAEEVVVSDAVPTTDQVATALGYDRSVTDTQSTTDQAATALEYERSVTDTNSVTDQVSIEVAGTYLRSASDTASVTDQYEIELNYVRTVTDTPSVSDQVLIEVGSVQESVSSDSVSTTEQITIDLSYGRTTSDTASVTDQITIETAGTFDRIVSDNVVASDQVSPTLTTASVVSDTASVSDQVGVSLEIGRVVSDTVTTTDQLSTVADQVRPITDDVGVTDLVTPLIQGKTDVITGDVASVSDSVSAILLKEFVVTDTASATDNLIVQLNALDPTGLDIAGTVGLGTTIGGTISDQNGIAGTIGTGTTVGGSISEQSGVAGTIGMADTGIEGDIK